MSIVESFKKIITFFDEIRNESIIEDYALIGGLALSAWIRPRATKDIDLIVVAYKDIKWKNVASIKVVVPEYLILLKLLPLSSQDTIDIRALVKKADRDRLKTLAQKHYLLLKLESVVKL